MDTMYDVAVIGAGIVGVSTALHLLMRGRKVLLLDRRGAGLETSYGNAGIIENYYVLPYRFPLLDDISDILCGRNVAARIHYPSLPHYLPWFASLYWQSLPAGRRKNGARARPLTRNALEEHKTLMRGTDAEKHLLIGKRVKLYRTQFLFELDAIERNLMQELGIPFDVMDAAAFSALEPHVKPVYHKVVRANASARVDNPGAVVTAYADRFKREGGAFITAQVNNLEYAAGSWNIETSQNSVAAKEAVICTGPWSNEMLKPLGYDFPMRLKRGYHKHFAAAGAAVLAHAIVDADIGFLLTPMEQTYRLTTGAEFADLDVPPNPVQLERALPYVRELFPLGEALEAKAWMGSRPCFADSLPVIGRAPRHDGLWFNFGQGHLGFTTGPASGRLLAEMMSGAKTFCDPSPYWAERFHA